MKNLILIFSLTTYYLLLTTSPTGAATLSNDTYIIQTNDINLQSKTSPMPETKASPTPEPLPKPFSFSISPLTLDFGEITPTDPTTRITTVAINPEGSLFALTDHELTSETKKIIPDTTCDNGTCTSKYASTWDSILTYGFGYKCCSNTGFMQLPNQVKGHVFSPILFGKTDEQTTITYKANISTSQDIGLYTNTIQLIAVPNF